MKKITIILLAMLLVASIGQAASAKASVGAFVGYDVGAKGFSVALNGEYEFVNWFSLAGEAEAIIVKDSGSIEAIYVLDLEGKFTFLSIGKFNLGAKLFVTGILNYMGGIVYVGPAIYANVTLFEKLKVELDYGCILLAMDLNTVGFYPLPYYADLGISFALSDNISLGIRGKWRGEVLDFGLSFGYRF